MLKPFYQDALIEAGCDEAGRGCLAGAVYAAAVILPKDYQNDLLNDSKQLTEKQRYALREQIEHAALAWKVVAVSNEDIDKMNILHASTHAMNLAVKGLTDSNGNSIQPEMLLIDGNRFYNETEIPHQCVVGGDGKYLSIAAASILAKTHRDEFMTHIDIDFPQYRWQQNKGYPTKAHYQAIEQYGISPWHRKSFNLFRTDAPSSNKR